MYLHNVKWLLKKKFSRMVAKRNLDSFITSVKVSGCHFVTINILFIMWCATGVWMLNVAGVDRTLRATKSTACYILNKVVY